MACVCISQVYIVHESQWGATNEGGGAACNSKAPWLA